MILKSQNLCKLSNVISLLFLSSEDETSPSSVESDTLQSADLGRFSHFHCIVYSLSNFLSNFDGIGNDMLLVISLYLN